MIPHQLISYYIDHCSLEDALKLAKKQGVTFTQDEGEIIYRFIKENKHLISLKNRPILEEKLKKVVGPTTYSKVNFLLSKFLD